MVPDQCTSKRVGPFPPHSGSGAGLGEKRRYPAAEDGELEKVSWLESVTQMWNLFVTYLLNHTLYPLPYDVLVSKKCLL